MKDNFIEVWENGGINVLEFEKKNVRFSHFSFTLVRFTLIYIYMYKNEAYKNIFFRMEVI